MSLKTVIVLKDGEKLRTFNCTLCDISDKAIRFRGVQSKNGNPRLPIDVNYYGNIYFEVDHFNKEAIVIPDEPGVQILVTW